MRGIEVTHRRGLAGQQNHLSGRIRQISLSQRLSFAQVEQFGQSMTNISPLRQKRDGLSASQPPEAGYVRITGLAKRFSFLCRKRVDTDVGVIWKSSGVIKRSIDEWQ